MNEVDIGKRLDELEKKIDAVYVSAEKTRKYFQILTIASIILFVLPLIGLIFEIPVFLSNYQSMMNF